MASKIFPIDAFEKNKSKASINLESTTIKAALLSDFSPTYSAWSGSTSYSKGDIVVPTSRNGRRYRATNGGTSASDEPSWPTVAGGTVSDNDITWEEYGGEYADNEFFDDVSGNEVTEGDGYTAGGATLSNKAIAQVTDDPCVTKWTADNVTWAGLTKTMYVAWIYVPGSTPGSDDYSICYVLLDDTPQSVSVDGVDFTLQFNTNGILTFGKKANL